LNFEPPLAAAESTLCAGPTAWFGWRFKRFERSEAVERLKRLERASPVSERSETLNFEPP
jgi:hypothetical protein